MFDAVWPWTGLGCVEWGYALTLAGLCVSATLVGVVNRTSRLLRAYYAGGHWPGMAHYAERGPAAVCGCGHHLSVHDPGTGRCCHGLAVDHLALLVTLPLPPLLREMAQRPGCPCRQVTDRKSVV